MNKIFWTFFLLSASYVAEAGVCKALREELIAKRKECKTLQPEQKFKCRQAKLKIKEQLMACRIKSKADKLKK